MSKTALINDLVQKNVNSATVCCVIIIIVSE
jgi:hypothetical protein